MGPRSRDRGIMRRRLKNPAFGELQWGRDHVIAELKTSGGSSAAISRLQWGRDHVIAELQLARLQEQRVPLLQWGRDHVIAEF